MLDSKDFDFVSKLNNLKFKSDCFSEDLVLYSEAVKIVEELQLKLASDLIQEIEKAVKAYDRGIGELQTVFKESRE